MAFRVWSSMVIRLDIQWLRHFRATRTTRSMRSTRTVRSVYDLCLGEALVLLHVGRPVVIVGPHVLRCHAWHVWIAPRLYACACSRQKYYGLITLRDKS